MKHVNAMLKDFGYFGNMDIKWIPYWRSEDYIKVNGNGQKVVATAYTWHDCPRGSKAMCVVVNTGDAKTKASVTLNGETLLGKGKSITTVIDAETGKEIATGDKLDLEIPRHDFRLLIIK
jgi:hypothetical protein